MAERSDKDLRRLRSKTVRFGVLLSFFVLLVKNEWVVRTKHYQCMYDKKVIRRKPRWLLDIKENVYMRTSFQSFMHT